MTGAPVRTIRSWLRQVTVVVMVPNNQSLHRMSRCTHGRAENLDDLSDRDRPCRSLVCLISTHWAATLSGRVPWMAVWLPIEDRPQLNDARLAETLIASLIDISGEIPQRCWLLWNSRGRRVTRSVSERLGSPTRRTALAKRRGESDPFTRCR